MGMRNGAFNNCHLMLPSLSPLSVQWYHQARELLTGERTNFCHLVEMKLFQKTFGKSRFIRNHWIVLPVMSRTNKSALWMCQFWDFSYQKKWSIEFDVDCENLKTFSIISPQHQLYVTSPAQRVSCLRQSSLYVISGDAEIKPLTLNWAPHEEKSSMKVRFNQQ